MKKLLSLGVFVSVMAMPNVAYAGCTHMHGSYQVSCENRVTVYRGQLNSLSTVGPNHTQSQLRIAKMQQDTARARINADRAAARDLANLKAQELDNARYAARLAYSNRSSRYGSRYGYGSYGYGNGGYGYNYGNGVKERRRGRNASGIERINRRLDRANIFGGQNDGRGRRSGASTPQPQPSMQPSMRAVSTPNRTSSKPMKHH